MLRARLIARYALSPGVAGYALIAYMFFPLGAVVGLELTAGFNEGAVGLYLHVIGSVAALAIGPFQFSSRLRARHSVLHRWLGRSYLGAGALIGGISGLYMAAYAFGGWGARLGFSCLSRYSCTRRCYPPALAYLVIAWLCWVPNLVVATPVQQALTGKLPIASNG